MPADLRDPYRLPVTLISADALTVTSNIVATPTRTELAALSDIAPGPQTEGWGQAHAAAWLRHLGFPGATFDPILFPVFWNRAGDTVTVDVWMGDYPAVQAARSRWFALDITERTALAERTPGQTVPLYAVGMALVTSVITADRKLFIAQRSQNMSYPCQWLSSASETLSAIDITPGGHLDAVSGALRAVGEELGVSGKPTVTTIGLVVDLEGNQLRVATTVDLADQGVAAPDLLAMWRQAPDSWEAATQEPVDLTVEGVREVFHDGRKWIRGEQLAVAASAARALRVPVEDLLRRA